MKFSTNIAAIATLLLSSSIAVAQAVGLPAAQDDSMQGAAGSARDVEALTDSQMGAGTSTLSDLSSGPIAFGVILSNGQKQSGTGNWSSTYNSSLKRYEVTITGQNYYYLSYSTLLTPAGDVRYCRTDSVGGKLLIYCYDASGAVQPARVAFTTFKAP
jgi:hypothetical protein